MARAAQHSIVSHPQLCTSYTVLYASNGPKQAFSVCFIPILFLILVFIFLFFFSFSSLPLLPLSLCYTTTLLLLLPLPPTIIPTADCHPPLSLARSPRPLDLTSSSSLLLHCYYDLLLPHSAYSSVYSFLFLHGLIPSRNAPLRTVQVSYPLQIGDLVVCFGHSPCPPGECRDHLLPLPTTTVNNSS